MKNIKLFSLISLLLINVLIAQPDATLTLPSDLSSSPGSIIETPILLSTDSLISQAQLALDYDSTKLAFIEALPGNAVSGFAVSSNTDLIFPPASPGSNKNVQVSLVAENSNFISGAEIAVINVRWQVSGYNGNASIQFDETGERSTLTSIHGTVFSDGELEFNQGAVTIIPDTTALMTLETDTTDVLENTLFEIQLGVRDVTDLHNYTSSVSFDPNIIRVDSVKPGAFLSNAGQAETTWNAPQLDNTNGLITNIQAERADTFGVFGNGILAELYFHALVPGKSNVNFVSTETNLNDPTDNNIPVAEYLDLELNVYREPVAELALPDTFAAQNRYIDVPITISGVGDVAIISALIEIEFDTTCLKGIDVINQGTLTESWQTPVVNNRDTSFYFALAGATPLAGDGILAFLRFYTNPLAAENDQCEMNFVDVLLNEGDPSTITQPGSFRVRGLQVAGSVDYQGTGLPVPFVELQMSGYQFITNQTNENGNFNFSRLHYGDYVLTPKKSGDQGQAVSPFDAALILQHVVGSSQLSPYQKIAADVSGDSSVSAFDASFIMRYAVELEEKFPVMDDADDFWGFVPGAFAINDDNWFAHPDTIPYSPLENDEFNQNFIGVIYGDVSQNWTSPSLQSTISESPKTIARIRSGAIQISDVNHVSLPIILEPAEAIHSVELEIIFPDDEMEIMNVARKFGSDHSLLSYRAKNNRLKIALASASPLKDEGEILSVQFLMKNATSFSSGEEIYIQQARLNDEPIPITTSVNGAINSTAPTRLVLSQNYPNPFNQSTMFRVDIPRLRDVEEVSLRIYNITGQLVRTLMQGNAQPGSLSVHWNGMDNASSPVSSGEYFAVLKAGEHRLVQRFILLR